MRTSKLVKAVALCVTAAACAVPASAGAASFTNGAQIGVASNFNAVGSVYPSPITVSGQKASIVKVKVSLNGWNDDNPFGMDVMLVSPGGKAVVVHDNGCVGSLNGETFTFDDDATATLPQPGGCNGKSGVYKPTGPEAGNAAFPAPAPAVTQNSTLSVFKGDQPNGTWNLFVRRDVNGGLGGSFQGGWTLDIESETRAEAAKKKKKCAKRKGKKGKGGFKKKCRKNKKKKK